MKDIRLEHLRQVLQSPWCDELSELEESLIRHSLGDGGGIESYTVTRRIACQCGCVQQPGGICSICGGVICVNCYVHCAGADCQRAIGPCCASMLEIKHTQVQLCKSCYEKAKRKRLASLLMRVLLWPFVRFNSEVDDG